MKVILNMLTLLLTLLLGCALTLYLLQDRNDIALHRIPNDMIENKIEEV